MFSFIVLCNALRMVDEKLENFDSLSDSHSAIWNMMRGGKKYEYKISLIATVEKRVKRGNSWNVGEKSLAQSELRKKIEIEEMRNEKWATAGSWSVGVSWQRNKKKYPELEIFIIFPVKQRSRRSLGAVKNCFRRLSASTAAICSNKWCSASFTVCRPTFFCCFPLAIFTGNKSYLAHKLQHHKKT